jgi:hypothetical protein
VNNALHYPSGLAVRVLGSAADKLRVEVGAPAENRVWVYYDGAQKSGAQQDLSACVVVAPAAV